MANLLVTGSGLSSLRNMGNHPPFMLHGNGNPDSYQLCSFSIQRPCLIAGCLELCVRFPDSGKLFLKIVEKLSHVTLRLPFVCEELRYTKNSSRATQLPTPTKSVIVLLLLLLPLMAAAKTLSGRVVKVVEAIPSMS